MYSHLNNFHNNDIIPIIQSQETETNKVQKHAQSSCIKSQNWNKILLTLPKNLFLRSVFFGNRRFIKTSYTSCTKYNSEALVTETVI